MSADTHLNSSLCDGFLALIDMRQQLRWWVMRDAVWGSFELLVMGLIGGTIASG